MDDRNIDDGTASWLASDKRTSTMSRARSRLPRSEREVGDISTEAYGVLLTTARNIPSSQQTKTSRKRKSPDEGPEYDRRSSPFDRRLQDSRTPSASRSPSVSSVATSPSAVIDIYNGVLDADEHGHVFVRQVSLPIDFLLSSLTYDTGLR